MGSISIASADLFVVRGLGAIVGSILLLALHVNAQAYSVPVYTDSACTMPAYGTQLSCVSPLSADECTFCPQTGQYMMVSPTVTGQLTLVYDCPTSSPTGRCSSRVCGTDTVPLGACAPVATNTYYVRAVQVSATPQAAGSAAPGLLIDTLLALFISWTVWMAFEGYM